MSEDRRTVVVGLNVHKSSVRLAAMRLTGDPRL
jgi:hypothetical protein